MSHSPKYFTIAELTRSNTADIRGIDNKMPKSLVPNALALIEHILDPLREAYGKPIHVTSGYRCEELNKAVAGARTSDHLRAMAADIMGTPRVKAENKKLFKLVQELDLPFKQLINENDFSWLHVSFDSGDIRKQILSL